MNWNARKLLANRHLLENITPTHHGKTFKHTQWNQYIWHGWVKGRLWQVTVQCQTKSDTFASSPGASRGVTFAWLICSFNSIVWPCECDYSVYWSPCFTYFITLDSSTRTTPILPLFPHFFPLLPFTKCFKYLLSTPSPTDSKSGLGIWTSKSCS